MDADGREGWALAKGVLVVTDFENFFDARHFIIKLIAFHFAGKKYRPAMAQMEVLFGKAKLGR